MIAVLQAGHFISLVDMMKMYFYICSSEIDFVYTSLEIKWHTMLVSTRWRITVRLSSIYNYYVNKEFQSSSVVRHITDVCIRAGSNRLAYQPTSISYIITWLGNEFLLDISYALMLYVYFIWNIHNYLISGDFSKYPA